MALKRFVTGMKNGVPQFKKNVEERMALTREDKLWLIELAKRHLSALTNRDWKDPLDSMINWTPDEPIAED